MCRSPLPDRRQRTTARERPARRKQITGTDDTEPVNLDAPTIHTLNG